MVSNFRTARFRMISAPLLALLVVCLAGDGAAAAADRRAAATGQSLDGAVAQIQQALDEKRYLDASRMLDEASLSGVRDARLELMAGELCLARGQFSGATEEFRKALSAPGLKARALQGQGLALSLEGKTEDAIAPLEAAVAQDPKLWRAWNALGAAYDVKRQWTRARDAYDQAIAASDGAAAAYNNRGYSLLLQGKTDAAVADFVAALGRKPDLAEARTNLRLALAMKGDYARAVSGGTPEDGAAALNNAGFAALMRGDYAHAEEILNRAMKAKSEYYSRAAANLELARQLKERSEHAD
jgi:Flp pilus assembly protein TadD